MNFKVLVVCLLLACLAPGPAFARNSCHWAANAEDNAAIEKEILRLEEVGRQKVLKGDNNWDDLIADGAYMIAFDGSIIHYEKGKQLPALPMKSFTLSEMIARVYGEVTVVTGLAEVAGETPDKKPFSFQMRFMNVWKKTGDSWQIVVSERTGVKPPAR